jgi:hypothetical protein
VSYCSPAYETDKTGVGRKTYGCVDGLIAVHVAVLVDPVVRLSKGDARNTASDEAKVDGVEAVKQVRSPAECASGRFRVDVLARSRQDIVEAILPVIHIVVVDRAALGRRRRLNRGWSRSSSRSRNRGSGSLSGSRHYDGLGIGYQ